jgi:hypothetical protein
LRYSLSPERLHRFDTISRFWVGSVGVLLSGVLGFSTIYSNRAASDRQLRAQNDATEREIHSQIDAAAAQRRTAGAQLAAALLPVIAKGTDSEREAALALLASAAPEQAQVLGAATIHLSGASAQTRVKEIVSTAVASRRQQEYMDHLNNARKFREFSLDANATREYFLAFEFLPPAASARVRPLVDAAREDYNRGRFSQSAGSLQTALNDLKP